jgi:hypothetical protein
VARGVVLGSSTFASAPLFGRPLPPPDELAREQCCGSCCLRNAPLAKLQRYQKRVGDATNVQARLTTIADALHTAGFCSAALQKALRLSPATLTKLRHAGPCGELPAHGNLGRVPANACSPALVASIFSFLELYTVTRADATVLRCTSGSASGYKGILRWWGTWTTRPSTPCRTPRKRRPRSSAPASASPPRASTTC